MSELKKRPILLFVIALIVLYAIIYIIPKVSGALVPSYIAEYGELKIYDETTAYLVRNEQVYTAGSGGKTNYYFKTGSLVRKGTTVMEVTGNSDSEIAGKYTDMLNRLGNHAVSSSDYTATNVGVVCYYADGYEGNITPKNMESGDYGYFSKLSQNDVIELERSSVAKGEPVFKIVDRTKWYMVCFVDEEHIDRYKKGSSVTVEFEDDFVEAEVYKAEKMDGKAKIILETDYYYAKFAETRVADVSLVTYDERGLVVENSSIAEKDGETGVYVKNRSNDFFFVPIKVYATDGEKSLIADDFFYDEKNDFELVTTVKIYDEILKNAK